MSLQDELTAVQATLPGSLYFARSLHTAGHLEEAMQAYEAIVTEAPTNASAWFGLGVLASEVGEESSAIDFMQEAVTFDPSNATYLASLGELQRRAGFIDAAIATLIHANDMFGGDLDVTINLGCALGERGDYAGARQQFQNALAMEAARSDIYFNFGVVEQRDGNHREAIGHLRIAVALAPDYLSAWNALAETLRRVGELDEAEKAFDRTLGIDPDDLIAAIGKADVAMDRADLETAQVWLDKAKATAAGVLELDLAEGRLLQARGQSEAAIACYERAIERFPRDLSAYRCLAAICREQNEFEKALNYLFSALAFAGDNCDLLLELAGLCYRDMGYSVAGAYFYKTALKLRPDHVPTLNTTGRALSEAGLNEEALECLAKAIDLEPENGESWGSLGGAQYRAGLHDEAMGSFQKAIDLGWEVPFVYNSMGNVCGRIGELVEAAKYYELALQHSPLFYSAAANLASVYFDLGRLKDSQRLFRLADGIPQNDKYRGQFELNRGFCELSSGRLETGWKGYDYRAYGKKPRYSYAPWQGENLVGKKILVWQDQGMGDVLMFGTMFAEIIEQAAACVIECIPKLIPLLRRTFPRADIVPAFDVQAKPHPLTIQAFDYQIAHGSLGQWLRPRLGSFPRRKSGYLALDRDRVKYWGEYWSDNQDTLKIGICWRSKVVDGGRSRFYSNLEDWGPIFAAKNVTFVNLQYDECAEELKTVKELFGVEVFVPANVDMFNDIDETASLIKSLDLVITAPTSVAMIAAAAGVPTWLMTVDGCMSWPLFGTKSHKWFPIIRPYLRHWNQPWAEILEQVGSDLADHLRSGGR